MLLLRLDAMPLLDVRFRPRLAWPGVLAARLTTIVLGRPPSPPLTEDSVVLPHHALLAGPISARKQRSSGGVGDRDVRGAHAPPALSAFDSA